MKIRVSVDPTWAENTPWYSHCLACGDILQMWLDTTDITQQQNKKMFSLRHEVAYCLFLKAVLQSVVPQLAASAAFGNLSEMHVLKP